MTTSGRIADIAVHGADVSAPPLPAVAAPDFDVGL